MMEKPVMVPLYGDMLTEKDLPPVYEGGSERFISFISEDNKVMDMTETQMSKHTLLIGGIGSGKTNCFNFIVQNLSAQMTDEDVMIIFDTKGDFYGEFFDDVFDCVIANSWDFAPVTSYWNIFREIEFGGKLIGERELMAKEIAKSLFDDRKNESQPFFTDAASDIFSKVLIYHMRKNLWDLPQYHSLEETLLSFRDDEAVVENCLKKERELFESRVGILNNQVLVKDILQKYTARDYAQMLRAYPDFASAISYIGEGTSNQALGVMGELNSMINDYFVGVFAGYAPGRDISMRELVHQKDGRKIFIEYDLSIGQVLCSVYRLLVDLALKEALGRSRSAGNVFLIIDEFKLLPKLTHLDDALNFGRSLGVKAFVGIQNIDQLTDIYGETAGKVIAAGFSNVMAFRMTDEPSRKYISELFGHNYVAISYWSDKGDTVPVQREGHCVEDWQLMDLHIGQAVVGLIGCRPCFFQFRRY